MAGTFSRSYQLVKESWAILKQDKELAMIPVVSAICSTIVLAVFVLIGFLLELRFGLDKLQTPVYYLFLFVYYFVTYFVISFFSAVMATCVSIRMKGGNPSLRDGINNAFAHIGSLALWSLLSATVGLILRIIAERSRLLGRIVASILGAVWSLATFFVIPVLVLENLSVGNGIKRSKDMFLKTWGENFVGGLGVGVFFGLLFIVGLVIGTAAMIMASTLTQPMIPMILIGAVCLLFFIVLGIISSALSSIFNIALYNYAATGAMPVGISPDLVQAAFKAKS